MKLIDNAIDAFRLKDTIFYKESSDLQSKYDALKKLNEEFKTNNEDFLKELSIVKKGLEGEKEISYQLKKSHIGMYVLKDIKVRYEDLYAQIDFIVITSLYTYFIECKNLSGKIIVTEKGDFVKELIANNRKIQKGIYSPLRQVEAQREVIRKIWESKSSPIKKLLASKNFDFYRRVLVVITNKETVLNTSKAPKDIKYKILKADGLVRQIEYDLTTRDKDEYLENKKSMEQIAQFYIDISSKEEINYYDFYKEKYFNNISNDNLKERLINLRKTRASEMNLPAYYIFTNEELEKLVEKRPKTIEELEKSKILTPIKLKVHGENIVKEINKIL